MIIMSAAVAAIQSNDHPRYKSPSFEKSLRPFQLTCVYLGEITFKTEVPMSDFIPILNNSTAQVWQTLGHNWFYLLISSLMAVMLKYYLKADRISDFIIKHRHSGIVAATSVAVTTPLCSCGTTAVVLGMITNLMPWGPIVAFMVASPLTSPQELIYSAGLFGWLFAWAFFLASILLGLTAGWLTIKFEDRGWLKNQARFINTTSGMSARHSQHMDSSRFIILLKDLGRTTTRLLAMFLGFAFIGYFLNSLIPSTWVTTLFGHGRIYSVPLAATLGLPLYLNTEASLPLVRTMLDAGMSQGAALAFMIAGAGTSIGAIAGALTIARWRVIGLVVGVLWFGSIIIGWVYNWF